MRKLAGLLLFGLLALPATADARWRAPCRPGAKGGPTCFWWKAHVRLVAAGDTLRVKLPRGGVRDIGLMGVDTAPLGRCGRAAGAKLVGRLLRLGGRDVYLAAQQVSSRSDGRLLRSVWIKIGGHLIDVGAAELTLGVALWAPSEDEWAHDDQYAQRAHNALLAQVGLYKPDACTPGPRQALPLRVKVRAGRWIDVDNRGAHAIRLGGWRVRAARRTYVLPRRTVLAPHTTIRIRVGCGRDRKRTLYWCRRVPSHPGASAYLFDPDGDLRAADIPS